MQREMGQRWGWGQEKSGGLWAASVPQEKPRAFSFEMKLFGGGQWPPHSSPWGSSVRISTVLKWNPWDSSQVTVMIVNSRTAATGSGSTNAACPCLPSGARGNGWRPRASRPLNGCATPRRFSSETPRSNSAQGESVHSLGMVNFQNKPAECQGSFWKGHVESVLAWTSGWLSMTTSRCCLPGPHVTGTRARDSRADQGSAHARCPGHSPGCWRWVGRRPDHAGSLLQELTPLQQGQTHEQLFHGPRWGAFCRDAE